MTCLHIEGSVAASKLQVEECETTLRTDLQSILPVIHENTGVHLFSLHTSQKTLGTVLWIDAV